MLVTLVLVAACVAAKLELNARAATAASEILKLRIALPPMGLGRSTIRLTTNVERQWQFPVFKVCVSLG